MTEESADTSALSLLQALITDEPTYLGDDGMHCAYCTGEWAQTESGNYVVLHHDTCVWEQARNALDKGQLTMRTRARRLEAEAESSIVELVMDLGEMLDRDGYEGLVVEILQLRTIRETLVEVGLRTDHDAPVDAG